MNAPPIPAKAAPACPYCGNPAELYMNSAPFYRGRDYGPIWACKPCEAWVGCHQGTITPLGRLADAALRQAKIRAHAAFDWIWRDNDCPRRSAYLFLAEKLGINPAECHIGMFDVETCDRVVAICRELDREDIAEIAARFPMRDERRASANRRRR